MFKNTTYYIGLARIFHWQNIWKQIYGYLDIDQDALTHLYVYYSFLPMPFADSIDEESNPSNSLLNGSYSPEELWDLKYEKLQSISEF